jgi:hypothetical protein
MPGRRDHEGRPSTIARLACDQTLPPQPSEGTCDGVRRITPKLPLIHGIEVVHLAPSVRFSEVLQHQERKILYLGFDYFLARESEHPQIRTGARPAAGLLGHRLPASAGAQTALRFRSGLKRELFRCRVGNSLRHMVRRAFFFQPHPRRRFSVQPVGGKLVRHSRGGFSIVWKASDGKEAETPLASHGRMDGRS